MSDPSSEPPGGAAPGRRVPSKGALTAIAIAAVLTALGVLVPKLSSLTTETRGFAELYLQDTGRIPQPLPESLVAAARRALRTGEAFSLHTPTGACPREERLYWLAFRLMPHIADCAAPDVAIYWGVPAPAGPEVVATGRGFAIVRP